MPDRFIRMGIGMLLVAVGVYAAYRINVWIGALILLAGIFAFYEAAVGWCAVYALLGRNTCPIQ